MQYGVLLFFFALMLFAANPFKAQPGAIPLDGAGPNPLLQNHPLVAIHPPFLYAGYVGFTIPFSFAIAALVTGRFGEGWLAAVRRTTLISWGFLTIGIVLGAWWSYSVLGWGGFWGWDPVENASLLPWLTATAFIHSVMVQERRGMLRVWNLSLVLATFCLTILGTFLTRSGVINSVHAFSQSSIGPWLLTFLGVCAFGSVGLVAWRGDKLRSPGRIDSPVSREAAFLLNNLLFAGFALVVLTGTVFPLLVEALQNKQITVGEPYFTRLGVPIGIALLFLMSVGPVLPWRAASNQVLRDRLLDPGVGGWHHARDRGDRRRPRRRQRRSRSRSGAFALDEHRPHGRRRCPRPQARHLRGAPGRGGAHGAVEHAPLRRPARARRRGRRRDRAGDHRRLHDEEDGRAVTRRSRRACAATPSRTSAARSTQSAQKTTIKARVHVSGVGDLAPAISTFPNAAEGIGTPSIHTDAVARRLPHARLVADGGPGDDRRAGRDDGDVPVDRRPDHGARLRARAGAAAQARRTAHGRSPIRRRRRSRLAAARRGAHVKRTPIRWIALGRRPRRGRRGRGARGVETRRVPVAAAPRARARAGAELHVARSRRQAR